MGRVYRIFFVFLLVILFLAEFFHPITPLNVDLERYLLLGKIIAETHQVPATNLLSYTYPDFPYVNTSWLTGVIYYYLFVWGGFSLLIIFNTFIAALAFGLLVFYCSRKYPLTIATIFSVTIYLLLLGFRSEIRPEVMSMMCLSLFMVILLSYRKKGDLPVGRQGKLILFLIPLEMLWVNLHIYFFVGPFLVLLFFLDHLIAHRFKFKNVRLYFLVLVGTIMAMFVNPNGIKGVLFPLNVFHNYGLSVLENQSIFTLFNMYHSPPVLLPVLVIVFLFGILFLARKNTRPIDWMLAIIFSLAAVFIFRNILLFIFATLPTFLTQLNFLINKYRPKVKNVPMPIYAYFYFLSLFFLAYIIIYLVNKDGFGVSAQRTTAVDFIVYHNIDGPFYNDFETGDALAYRIYPQLVFVDSRPEAYPASFFKSVYTPMQDDPRIFEKLDITYHFNALLILYIIDVPGGHSLLKYLVNSSNFKLIYLDEYMVLLVRNTAANKELIDRYSIDKNGFAISSSESLEDLFHKYLFFDKVGWRREEEAVLVAMRKSDPELCVLKKYLTGDKFLSSYFKKHHLGKHCSMNLFRLKGY
jgi:hypothetical protein